MKRLHEKSDVMFKHMQDINSFTREHLTSFEMTFRKTTDSFLEKIAKNISVKDQIRDLKNR